MVTGDVVEYACPTGCGKACPTLADVGAVKPPAVDEVVNRVSAHDDLDTALAPCAAVMESIVEDAEAKAACYRDIEAVIGADVPLWSSTSNFPMTRLAAGMAHPERAIVLHPVQTQLIIFVEVVPGERTERRDGRRPRMRFCDDVDLRAIRVRQGDPGIPLEPGVVRDVARDAPSGGHRGRRSTRA